MFLFFMENNIVAIIVWLLVFLIAIGIEISTTQLVSIWFSGGAIISLILACFDVYWLIQLITFVGVSILLLFVTKPLIKKKLIGKDYKTNVNSLVGDTVLITKDVSSLVPGEGKIRDVTWTCKTDDFNTLPQGSYARVVAVRGNSLFVTKKEIESC